MKIFTILALITGCLMILSCSDSSSEPEPDDTFYLGVTPAANTISVGSNAMLSVQINSVEGFFASSFDLLFDNTVVQVDTIQVSASGLLADYDPISFYDEIENGMSVSVGLTQTEEDDDLSGSGTLLVITFEGAAEGSTPIEFENVVIIDEQGEDNPDLDNLELRFSQITVE